MDHFFRRQKTNLESIFSASHLEFKRIQAIGIRLKHRKASPTCFKLKWPIIHCMTFLRPH
uniref:Uncharacterized protein n=1 Tax=Utricularia reniformis TaxID=192314 RepID=A0A1Y0B1L4_9LAMI|nr:hypothetical protein AEK19_MT1051 [Utricularia reniformis]ART31274.1 hypothetical protein AEK19_MT1051 [Utricularia reniformis]